MMNKSAFTLVELLVGITISILLMTSIGVFVSSGMNNILFQKKILDENSIFSSHVIELQSILEIASEEISTSATGILVKNLPDYDRGGYTYIGTKSLHKHYCQTGEILDTSHVFTSSFIPFEEATDNINTAFSDTLESAIVTVGGIGYKTSIKDHQVIDTTNSITAVGKNIFGDKLEEGATGTEVFLNSPTGLVEVNGKLVFSDTLNNRILYMSGGLIYTLLDEKNGLEEPTGLAYLGGVLYISNSAKGEVLTLSSVNHVTNPQLHMNFSPDSNINNINKIKLHVFTGSVNISQPDNRSDFTLSGPGLSSNVNDFVQTLGNTMSYYFISSYGGESLYTECLGRSSGDIVVNASDTPIRCSSSGTGALANLGPKNFSSFGSYNVEVGTGDITPVLADYKNYYVSMQLLSGNTTSYEKNFPYFTQGDGDIFTKDDNNLEVFASGLLYPTGLSFNAGKLIINTFEDRKTHTYDIDGTKDSDITRAPAFSNTLFSNNYPESLLVKNPIKDISINRIASLLNLKLEYYKYWNCFNPDEKVEKTLLLKKSF